MKTGMKNMWIGLTALMALAEPARAGLQLVVAPDASVQECDYSGQTLSKKVTSADLIKQCHDAVLAIAAGPANRWSSEGTLPVFGYHGLLFIDSLDTSHPRADGSIPQKQTVIAGSNVVFKSVQ